MPHVCKIKDRCDEKLQRSLIIIGKVEKQQGGQIINALRASCCPSRNQKEVAL